MRTVCWLHTHKQVAATTVRFSIQIYQTKAQERLK